MGMVSFTLHWSSPDDTIGDLKKLVAAQTGTRPEKIRIQKWYTVYKDHITLEDCKLAWPSDSKFIPTPCSLLAWRLR